MRLVLGAALVVSMSFSARAQSAVANDPQLADTLAKAAAQADALQRDLPSFTCTVSGHSDIVQGDRVEHSTAFRGTIRAQRQNGRMVEGTTYTDVDGKPYSEKHHPYFVHGGFTDVLLYVSEPLQQCSQFARGAEGRIEFHAYSPSVTGCGRYRGLEGFFTTDAAGNITHIERRLPESDELDALVPYAAIDLAPVELNGKMYRLATHIRSERPLGDVRQRFEADYTECKLFTTGFRILPGVAPVDDAKPQP